jgi:hypothetical protein
MQEDANSTDPSPLVARQQVRVCDYIITGAACYALGSGLTSNVKQLGQAIYDPSQGNSCGTFTGTVSAFTYRYRASGNQCDTTAQRATIEGGILRHLESRNKQICGTECWDMSHGGTWNGYLAIGKPSIFDRNVGSVVPSLDVSHDASRTRLLLTEHLGSRQHSSAMEHYIIIIFSVFIRSLTKS